MSSLEKLLPEKKELYQLENFCVCERPLWTGFKSLNENHAVCETCRKEIFYVTAYKNIPANEWICLLSNQETIIYNQCRSDCLAALEGKVILVKDLPSLDDIGLYLLGEMIGHELAEIYWTGKHHQSNEKELAYKLAKAIIKLMRRER